jgi:hypothetical protein
MATYICIAANFATIENGPNKGQEYISAQFQIKGTDPRSGRRPQSYNFFAPTGLEDQWKEAWMPTVKASTDGGKELYNESSDAYFAIEAQTFTIKVEDHAKKYRQDTKVGDKIIKAGAAIRINGDPLHAQKFNTVNVFDECTYSADGKAMPIHDVERIANRILERSCIPWKNIPDDAKLPADRGTGAPEEPKQAEEEPTF